MKSIDGDKLRGHLEMLILATLEKGDAHGLEILQQLKARGCGLLKLKEGSLYPALYRLENSGHVAAEWEPQVKGRRGARRRVYRLTGKGKRQLDRSRGEWQDLVSIFGQILSAPA